MVAAAVTLLDGKPATPARGPFRHGEELAFDVSWMGVRAGTLRFCVDAGGRFRDRPAVHLRGSARTSPAFSLLFPVADSGESWIDPEGLYSLGFLSDQNEGSRKDRQHWTLDNERAVAVRERVWSEGSGGEERAEEEFPLSWVKLQDAASIFYYYRAFPLRAGSVLSTPVFVDRKVWELSIEVASPEEVATPAGSFACLPLHPRISPGVSPGGEELEAAAPTLWVSADQRLLPVKMESRLPLGKISAVLTRFQEGEPRRF